MSAAGDRRFDPAALMGALADLPGGRAAPQALAGLVRDGFDRLPLPGLGETLVRWRALSAVAAHDLSLAKLYEGHTDALAILAELGDPSLAVPGSTWGVWAAEAPSARAIIAHSDGRAVILQGAKAWCSGAGSASHALLTAWCPGASSPQLVALTLDQPGVVVDDHAWQAVGMRESASLDVTFDAAEARQIGTAGAYLSRPGFWQGGAGIAACWYGGALGLARKLQAAVAAASARDSFRLAALGRVDLALHSTAAILRECAAWIDANPRADAHAVALKARLAAEGTASTVLDEVGRALGATPFCRDARFARAAADLPVFIRQSHAERDLAALGERVLESDVPPWTL